MDKFFLLTYTSIDYDGFRHSHHSWFDSEEGMMKFIRECMDKNVGFEKDLAIEILSHREVKTDI